MAQTVSREMLEMMADGARAWARQNAPLSGLHAMRNRHAELGYDPGLYAGMAEIGWPGALVPERYGGHDLGYECMGTITEALGRTLVPSPLIASAVAATSAILIGADEELKQKWLPAMAAGDSIGTLALENGRQVDISRSCVRAQRSKNGWVLDGHKSPVEMGMAANFVILLAATSDNPNDEQTTLFLCSTTSPGLERLPLDEADVRGRGAYLFDAVKVHDGNRLSVVGAGQAVARKVLARSAAVAAAEMLGGAVQAFELTIEYLQTRMQFGKVIGSFQALQHRAADMLADIGLARAATYEALRAIDRDDKRADLLASVSKLIAGRTFQNVAREMIQMHGGIGMTDEHVAGFYLKRACATDIRFGNTSYHREQSAQLMGL